MDEKWLDEQIQALESQKADALRTVERCEGALQLGRFALAQIERREREAAAAVVETKQGGE